MDWWRLLKATPRSRREAKEQKKWLEDFKNEIDEQRGLEDAYLTDALSYEDYEYDDKGELDKKRSNMNMIDRLHREGLTQDNKQFDLKYREKQKMRDRVKAMAHQAGLQSKHGVARRNMDVEEGGDTDEPVRGKAWDEKARSLQPTLKVGYSRMPRPTVNRNDVQGLSSTHPLDPEHTWGENRTTEQQEAADKQTERYRQRGWG